MASARVKKSKPKKAPASPFRMEPRAKERRGRFGKIDLPNPVAVAAFDGILDAVQNIATGHGMSSTASSAMRSVTAVLIGLGLAESKKDLVVDLEGCGKIKIRPADAKAAAMRGFSELARLETMHALKKVAK